MQEIRNKTDYDTYYPATSQFEIAENMEQVRHTGQTLAQAAAQTGKQAALSWLSKQLYELPNTFGMAQDEWLRLTQRIYSLTKNRTLPQIMCFIFRTGRGDFGKIFGKPNTTELGGWWKTYDATLDSIIYRQEQKPKQVQHGRFIDSAEYEQLKQAAYFGDKEAQDGFFPPIDVMKEQSNSVLDTYAQYARDFERWDMLERIDSCRR